MHVWLADLTHLTKAPLPKEFSARGFVGQICAPGSHVMPCAMLSAAVPMAVVQPATAAVTAIFAPLCKGSLVHRAAAPFTPFPSPPPSYTVGFCPLSILSVQSVPKKHFFLWVFLLNRIITFDLALARCSMDHFLSPFTGPYPCQCKHAFLLFGYIFPS